MEYRIAEGFLIFYISTAHMTGPLKGWYVKGRVSVGEVHQPKVR